MPQEVVVFIVTVVVAALALLGVAFFVTRREPAFWDEVETDRADIGLPQDRTLRSDDIDRLRFRVVGGIRGIRGYHFADVDAVMMKVRETLAALEERAE